MSFVTTAICMRVAHALAERIHQRGLAGAHGAAHTDAQGFLADVADFLQDAEWDDGCDACLSVRMSVRRLYARRSRASNNQSRVLRTSCAALATRCIGAALPMLRRPAPRVRRLSGSCAISASSMLLPGGLAQRHGLYRREHLVLRPRPQIAAHALADAHAPARAAEREQAARTLRRSA